MDAQPQIIMEIDRVRKEFGGLVALDDVSFRVPEEQILALIGPTAQARQRC